VIVAALRKGLGRDVAMARLVVVVAVEKRRVVSDNMEGFYYVFFFFFFLFGVVGSTRDIKTSRGMEGRGGGREIQCGWWGSGGPEAWVPDALQGVACTHLWRHAGRAHVCLFCEKLLVCGFVMA
jgi:hypothetical protein